MNRKRIGLVALAVAVAAVVRQRLRTRLGPAVHNDLAVDRDVAAEAVLPTQPHVGDESVVVAKPIDEEPRIEVPELDLGEAVVGPPTVDGAEVSSRPEVPSRPEVSSRPEGSMRGRERFVDSAADTIRIVVPVAGGPQPTATNDQNPPHDAELGTPAIDLGHEVSSSPVATSAVIGQPEIDPTRDDSSSRSQDVSPAESGSTDDQSSSPPIVLPSMPLAGTTDVLNPIATGDTAPLAEAVPSTLSAAGSGWSAPANDARGEPLDRDTSTTPGFALTPPVPTGPGSERSTLDANESSKRNRGPWTILGTLLLGLLVVGVIAASFVRLPYYRLEPGSVYDTIERVDAPVELVTIPDGEIGFVTVSQTANITPWEWLDAKLDDSVRLRHEDEVQGDQTAEELREADLRRMQVSKNSAVVVALGKLGYDLEITPIGVEVAEVFDCTAADGKLGTGDLIIGVNGVEVLDGEKLVEQLMGIGVGQDVELLVERIDPANPTQSMSTELVGLTLGSADDACIVEAVRSEESRPFIGIGTLTIVEEDFPIEVNIETGRVSGPSAGLAFTLAIMDVLSEGELTSGMNIVATGSIDRDGNVGPVGGIHQKTIAAERDGADVFIVPLCCDNFVDRETGDPVDLPTNYEEALEHAVDMKVIGVNNIDEALIAIGELGGDVSPFTIN